MSARGSKYQYEVIEAFDPSKKYDVRIQKRHREILEKFDTVGYVFSPGEFYNNNLTLMKSNNRTLISAQSVLSVSIRVGTDLKILKRKTSDATVPKWFKELETVDYWSMQLRGSKMKNVKIGNRGTVRSLYIQQLWNFNKWLIVQTQKIKKTTQIKENVFEQVELEMKFENIEELFGLLTQPIPNRTAVVKIIKKYLMDTELHEGKMASYMKAIKSSILSYFEKNDQSISISFDPKTLYTSSDEAAEQQEMSLVDFMQIMTLGKPDATEKAVFVSKFHRGLDASTLVDRFNFEVWPLLVKWFGSDDHNTWDLKKCPVITEHVRIKTTFRHPGGLDVDAIEAIQSYLNYREKITGQIMMTGKPLFVNRNGGPITLGWVFKHFFKLAKKSGVLKKLPELNSYNVDSHEARDLLKSTMIACGAATWAADIAIGHKPDSYEKVATLFPTKFRSEFAKCSKLINIFSKIASIVQGDETPKDVIDELNSNFDKKLKLSEEQIENLVAQGKRKDDMVIHTLKELQKQIDELKTKKDS
ncbi:MAG: hypothetical protein JKY15_01915 [Deltaproteobacteria bacterium]|nr:hypothetical protein [Deltaproteobacteria bacterium]